MTTAWRGSPSSHSEDSEFFDIADADRGHITSYLSTTPQLTRGEITDSHAVRAQLNLCSSPHTGAPSSNPFDDIPDRPAHSELPADVQSAMATLGFSETSTPTPQLTAASKIPPLHVSFNARIDRSDGPVSSSPLSVTAADIVFKGSPRMTDGNASQVTAPVHAVAGSSRWHSFATPPASSTLPPVSVSFESRTLPSPASAVASAPPTSRSVWASTEHAGTGGSRPPSGLVAGAATANGSFVPPIPPAPLRTPQHRRVPSHALLGPIRAPTLPATVRPHTFDSPGLLNLGVPVLQTHTQSEVVNRSTVQAPLSPARPGTLFATAVQGASAIPALAEDDDVFGLRRLPNTASAVICQPRLTSAHIPALAPWQLQSTVEEVGPQYGATADWSCLSAQYAAKPTRRISSSNRAACAGQFTCVVLPACCMPLARSVTRMLRATGLAPRPPVPAGCVSVSTHRGKAVLELSALSLVQKLLHAAVPVIPVPPLPLASQRLTGRRTAAAGGSTHSRGGIPGQTQVRARSRGGGSGGAGGSGSGGAGVPDTRRGGDGTSTVTRPRTDRSRGVTARGGAGSDMGGGASTVVTSVSRGGGDDASYLDEGEDEEGEEEDVASDEEGTAACSGSGNGGTSGRGGAEASSSQPPLSVDGLEADVSVAGAATASKSVAARSDRGSISLGARRPHAALSATGTANPPSVRGAAISGAAASDTPHIAFPTDTSDNGSIASSIIKVPQIGGVSFHAAEGALVGAAPPVSSTIASVVFPIGGVRGRGVLGGSTTAPAPAPPPARITTDPVWAMRFSLDGRYLAAAGGKPGSGIVRVWEVNPWGGGVVVDRPPLLASSSAEEGGLAGPDSSFKTPSTASSHSGSGGIADSALTRVVSSVTQAADVSAADANSLDIADGAGGRTGSTSEKQLSLTSPSVAHTLHLPTRSVARAHVRAVSGTSSVGSHISHSVNNLSADGVAGNARPSESVRVRGDASVACANGPFPPPVFGAEGTHARASSLPVINTTSAQTARSIPAAVPVVASAFVASPSDTGPLVTHGRPLFRPVPMQEWCGHSGPVVDLSWSRAGLLLSASLDGDARLWHVTQPACLHRFAHPLGVSSAAFHPLDDYFFATGCLDKKLRVWSIDTGRVVFWQILPTAVTAVAFTPDARYILAGLANGCVSIYTTDGLRYVAQTECRDRSGPWSRGCKVTGIEFMPVSPALASNVDANNLAADAAPVSVALGMLQYSCLVTTNDSAVRLLRFGSANCSASANALSVGESTGVGGGSPAVGNAGAGVAATSSVAIAATLQILQAVKFSGGCVNTRMHIRASPDPNGTGRVICGSEDGRVVVWCDQQKLAATGCSLFGASVCCSVSSEPRQRAFRARGGMFVARPHPLQPSVSSNRSTLPMRVKVRSFESFVANDGCQLPLLPSVSSSAAGAVEGRFATTVAMFAPAATLALARPIDAAVLGWLIDPATQLPVAAPAAAAAAAIAHESALSSLRNAAYYVGPSDVQPTNVQRPPAATASRSDAFPPAVRASSAPLAPASDAVRERRAAVPSLGSSVPALSRSVSRTMGSAVANNINAATAALSPSGRKGRHGYTATPTTDDNDDSADIARRAAVAGMALQSDTDRGQAAEELPMVTSSQIPHKRQPRGFVSPAASAGTAVGAGVLGLGRRNRRQQLEDTTAPAVSTQTTAHRRTSSFASRANAGEGGTAQTNPRSGHAEGDRKSEHSDGDAADDSGSSDESSSCDSTAPGYSRLAAALANHAIIVTANSKGVIRVFENCGLVQHLW